MACLLVEAAAGAARRLLLLPLSSLEAGGGRSRPATPPLTSHPAPALLLLRLPLLAPPQVAQRRYVLLPLWMARHGTGLLPAKSIVDAARRLRVS